MSKTKLTLYIEEEIGRIAHKTARLSGKSISNMVGDYFVKKSKMAAEPEISPAIADWVGILHTKKTYRKLRDDLISARLKKYENTG